MPSSIPELPRVTPNYDSVSFAGGGVVSIPDGGSIDAALSTAQTLIANGTYSRVSCQMAPGGSYPLSNEILFTKYTTDPNKWIELTTAGFNLNTRITKALAASQNCATIHIANGQLGCHFDYGAQGYKLRGFKMDCGTVQDQRAFIDTSPGFFGLGSITTLPDFPSRLSFKQLCIVGNAALHTRRTGIRLNCSMTDLSQSWIEHINLNGIDYSNQSQPFNYYMGFGGLRIEDNFAWRATEGMAAGGAGHPNVAILDRIQPEDITMRRNHFYVPLTYKGIEGSANASECKVGRRVLIESNIYENTWNELQQGFGIVGWSADYSWPWTQSSDWTVRKNWIKNCNCGIAFVKGYDVTGPDDPQKPMKPNRMWAEHNIATGLGSSVTIGPDNTTTGTAFFIHSDSSNVCLRRNSILLPGETQWLGLDIINPSYINLDVLDNIGGTSAFGYIVFTAGIGQGQAGWDGATSNGSCRNQGNVYVNSGISVPNPGLNTTVANLTGVGFADPSVIHSSTTKYADLGGMVVSGANASKGADMTAVLAGLSGVETATSDLPT